jgi:hypothetical protein
MLKKFPLQFLNSLLGCSGCMGFGIVIMKQYLSCLDVFCELHPEASTELHSTMHHAMKTYGKCRYSSTIIDLGTRWKCVISFTPRTL